MLLRRGMIGLDLVAAAGLPAGADNRRTPYPGAQARLLNRAIFSMREGTQP
jgi:hypothetical protein